MSSPTKSNVFTKLIPIKRTAPPSLRNTGIFRRKNRQTKQITAVCHSLALGKHSGLFLPFADCWHKHSYSSWPRHNEICSSWHTALPDTVWLPEVTSTIALLSCEAPGTLLSSLQGYLLTPSNHHSIIYAQQPSALHQQLKNFSSLMELPSKSHSLGT